MRVISFIIILVSFKSVSAFAAQTMFNKVIEEEVIRLQYEWDDHLGNARKFDLEFDKQVLADQFRQTKNYRPEIAQRFIYIAMQRERMKANPRDARIQLKQVGREIQFEVQSSSAEMRQRWMENMYKAQQSAFDQYLGDNYYTRYVGPMGERAVKPDHIRYVSENVQFLLPAAQAIYDQLDANTDSRVYVNLLLSWVQSIPYSVLQDRLTSNGSGYSAPMDVLTNNLGDCDSKTVLIAALMRSLLPKMSMVMIFLPNHALLGANLPHRENERTLELNGLKYLLLEPTGPALMRVGEIAPSSENYIGGGMYTYERVP